MGHVCQACVVIYISSLTSEACVYKYVLLHVFISVQFLMGRVCISMCCYLYQCPLQWDMCVKACVGFYISALSNGTCMYKHVLLFISVLSPMGRVCISMCCYLYQCPIQWDMCV